MPDGAFYIRNVNAVCESERGPEADRHVKPDPICGGGVTLERLFALDLSAGRLAVENC